MFNREELEELLEEIGAKIERQISVFIIGGCALSFKGLKESTKDIDIIVSSKSDFDVFDRAMKESGFQSMNNRENEFYLSALAVYTKEKSRIDVFVKQVGKMLFLTKSMIERAEEYRKYGKLTVSLISNEDIFLFKIMTSREGDIYDCDRIMRGKMDYSVIYNEIVEQSKEEGKRWFFWVYENLCKLEEHNGISVPIKNKIFSLVKEYWDERPDDFMEDAKDKERHILDKSLLNELTSSGGNKNK